METDSEKIDGINKRLKNMQRVQIIQGVVTILVAFGIMTVIIDKVKKSVK